MAISKDKLIGKEGVSLEVDSVTSYLSSAAGDITTTSAGGKIAIDVAIADASGISLDVALSAATDSVAAWLADGAGNPITSTAGSLHVRLNEVNTTDNALQVYINDQAGPLQVEATALDIRALSDATDSVAAVQSGAWSVTASATDFDIRDLSAVTDSVSAWMKDGTGNGLISSAGALHVSLEASNITDLDIRDLAFATDKVDVSGSSVTVSATDFDIRNLDWGTDTVQAYMRDGVGNSITSSNNSLHVTQRGAVAFASSANSITTTAELLVASPLTARTSVLIQNLGNQAVFLGDVGVTSATGIRIPAGANVELALGAVGIYAITSAGTADVRVLELAY